MGKAQLTTESSEGASLNHSLKPSAACTSWWHPIWKVSSSAASNTLVMCRHGLERSHLLPLKTAEHQQPVMEGINIPWPASVNPRARMWRFDSGDAY